MNRSALVFGMARPISAEPPGDLTKIHPMPNQNSAQIVIVINPRDHNSRLNTMFSRMALGKPKI
jgi:hypothetical protein